MADALQPRMRSVAITIGKYNMKNWHVILLQQMRQNRQKNIVSQITSKKGNYILSLKRNQRKLYNAVKQHIEKQGKNNKNSLRDGFDDSHDRYVRRHYFGYDVSKLPEIQKWSNTKTVVAVETIASKNNDLTRTVTAE